MISDEGIPLLGDFGLSAVKYEYTKNKSTAISGGTYIYMPPEWLLDAGSTPQNSQSVASHGSATMHSDVYSLSVTLVEILVGQAPYSRRSPAHPVLLLSANPPIPPFEKPYPSVNLNARNDDIKELWRTMERCWSFVPQDRPQVSDLHSWFKNLKEHISPSKTQVQGKVWLYALWLLALY